MYIYILLYVCVCLYSQRKILHRLLDKRQNFGNFSYILAKENNAETLDMCIFSSNPNI